MIDATPRKIEYYDPESKNYWSFSKREYFEVEGVHYEKGDYYTFKERRHVSLYLDPATGLAVFDIHAYEKWIESRG